MRVDNRFGTLDRITGLIDGALQETAGHLADAQRQRNGIKQNKQTLRIAAQTLERVRSTPLIAQRPGCPQRLQAQAQRS